MNSIFPFNLSGYLGYPALTLCFDTCLIFTFDYYQVSIRYSDASDELEMAFLCILSRTGEGEFVPNTRASQASVLFGVMPEYFRYRLDDIIISPRVKSLNSCSESKGPPSMDAIWPITALPRLIAPISLVPLSTHRVIAYRNEARQQWRASDASLNLPRLHRCPIHHTYYPHTWLLAVHEWSFGKESALAKFTQKIMVPELCMFARLRLVRVVVCI